MASGIGFEDLYKMPLRDQPSISHQFSPAKSFESQESQTRIPQGGLKYGPLEIKVSNNTGNGPMSPSTENADPNTQFFKDGVRRIDFILVYQEIVQEREKKRGKGTEDHESRRAKREVFQKDLEDIGLKLEIARQDAVEDEEGANIANFQKGFSKIQQYAGRLQRSFSRTEQNITESPPLKSNPYYFIKIHAPWHTLCLHAEELHLYAPVKDTDKKTKEVSIWDRLKNSKLFKFTQADVPEHLEVPDEPTQVFIRSKLAKYYKSDEEKTFFSPAQRSLIVNHILNKARYYSDEDTGEKRYGISRLLRNKTYIDAFPLHEGNFKQSKEDRDADKPLTERQFLYENWGSYKVQAFFKFQPFDQIRHYFGEKIAFYFAWLGFYTKWLHYATLMGLIVFIVSLYTLDLTANVIANEVCDDDNWNIRKMFYMCPRCELQCDFWILRDSCISYRFSLMFDYWGTVIFAICMSLWAVFFLEFWKRYQFYLQYEWDVIDYEVVQENPRPQFESAMRKKFDRAKSVKKDKIFKENPITRTMEFFQEDYIVKTKLFATLSTLTMLVMIVIAAVVGIIFYRAAIYPLLYQAISLASSNNDTNLERFLSIFGAFLVTTSAGLIQLIFIFIMNKLYEKIAYFLTSWELHRTQTEHEDAFTVKMYLFQFVNFYSSLFYIAFFKGRIFVHFPGKGYGDWYGLEQCATYGCLLELTIQMIIIFLLKQSLNNFVELILPLFKILIKYIKLYFSKRGLGKTSKDSFTESHENVKLKDIKNKLKATTPWGRDFQLAPERDHGLFWEYLELVIQFGFVTIFAAAFPLSPLFALFNNYFEVRIDGSKFILLTRRPLASKSQDIGPWYNILDIISKIAVVSNALLIPFTGGFIDRILYQAELNRGVNRLEGFLENSFDNIPIMEFMFTNDFPEPGIRSLSNNLTGGDLYTPYFNPAVYYCESRGCDNITYVDANVQANLPNVTNCCEYLLAVKIETDRTSLTNVTLRGSSCLNTVYNNVTCCRNLADNNTKTEKLNLGNTNLITTPATTCCDLLNSMHNFTIATNAAEYRDVSNRTGIFYKFYNSNNNFIYDSSSPRNGFSRTPGGISDSAEYYEGCNVNKLNSDIVCMFRPTYHLNPYADFRGEARYYRTMMTRLLFVVVFEHVIFLVVAIVAYLVPDIPGEVKEQLYREKYLAKYAEYEEDRKKREQEQQKEDVKMQEQWRDDVVLNEQMKDENSLSISAV